VYARVSTSRQIVAQSIDQQLERPQAHVAAHIGEGWDLREEHVFRDDGYSGARLQRPGLDRLRGAGCREWRSSWWETWPTASWSWGCSVLVSRSR
jgi:hypothetical protein